jgi:hypothetical protein
MGPGRSQAGIAILTAALALLLGCAESAEVIEPSVPTFSADLELRDASGNPAAGFPAGEPVVLVLRVRNLTDEARKLTLGTSQKFDFEVEDPSRGTVWRWSHDQAFLQVLTDLSFAPGETKTFSESWDQTDDAGKAVPAGAYDAVGFVCHPGPGLRSPAVRFLITQ